VLRQSEIDRPTARQSERSWLDQQTEQRERAAGGSRDLGRDPSLFFYSITPSLPPHHKTNFVIMSSEVPATPVDETVYQGAIGIGTYPAQRLSTKPAF
jgi:hypothetical protein